MMSNWDVCPTARVRRQASAKGTPWARSTCARSARRCAVATTTGLMQQGSTLGQFLSPPLIAAVHAASGGWQHTWWATGALALGDLAMAWLVLRFDRADRRAREAAPRG